jgi:hypothetical protein
MLLGREAEQRDVDELHCAVRSAMSFDVGSSTPAQTSLAAGFLGASVSRTERARPLGQGQVPGSRAFLVLLPAWAGPEKSVAG